MRDLLAFDHRDRRERPSPLLRTIVGAVLRRTRLDQGRTLADVARSARMSMQYLSELERGRKEASSEILAALCGALRIDLSELLAAVGHDLLDRQRGHPATVVRLDRFRDGAAPSGGDAAVAAPVPPAGAEQAPAISAPADLLASAGGSGWSSSRAAAPARGSGDAVGRLAA